LLIEAFFNCLPASCIGIMVAELFLPHFNEFLGKPLRIQIFTDACFAALFATFVVFLSLTAGFLPAMLLSKISPLHLFKPYSAFQGGGKIFRNVFTMFQFAVAIALVCTLLIMSEQIDHVKHKDLGFDTEYLLNLKVGDTGGGQLNTLMNKLEQYHGIKAMSATLGIPGRVDMTLNGYKTIYVDANAVKTFGFKVVQGRNLLPGDLNKACLINTAALANFEDGDFHGKKVFGVEIVGVVSDFHYSSLYEKTGPMALAYVDLWGKTHLTLRISGPVGEAVAFIKKTWMETCPDYPFELRFYDDYFDSMYSKEEKLARLIAIFSILAVVISCLGIFGLAFFQSEQRVKEIGIRKVLGASVYEIVAMLSKNFTQWVVVANVVAWPVVWYAMNKWLQNFAYRIEIGWWMFALAGGLALLIALLTVSTQALKAALANPVEALRYE
jgi:putative ABC transport system permease protein